MEDLLYKRERELLDKLGECFNNFKYLPQLHPSDLKEFQYAIHLAQNIILARPALEHRYCQKLNE